LKGSDVAGFDPAGCIGGRLVIGPFWKQLLGQDICRASYRPHIALDLLLRQEARMGDLVDFVARVLRESGAWAGLIFGLLAFAESTAFLGALVPATPVLLLVGGLLAAGELNPWHIVPAAIAGAFLGYGGSYAYGRSVGPRLGRLPRLRRHRRAIARSRLFFRRFGFSSLIFGRYVLGPFQSLLPFVAGASGMDAKRFWAVNTLSSCLWVPLCLAPGYFATRVVGSSALSADVQILANQLIFAISLGAASLAILTVAVRYLRAR
jgi:membrane protein DedA with SNARE-associated domain